MKSFTETINEVGYTDKESTHKYGEWYDYWFTKLQDKSLNILEVGVCVFGGGGTLSLAKYFENSTVYAVDIDKCQCIDAVFNHPRIKFFEGDAYNNEILKNFKDVKFDIVIDDAHHEINYQLKLLKMLIPYLKDDGMYIVEDCCTCHWLPHLKELWELGLSHTLIDITTLSHYDSTLIKFTKNK